MNDIIKNSKKNIKMIDTSESIKDDELFHDDIED
jgi:hypothetical protein